MCLYPKTIWNKKYWPNKKNGGNPPKAWDERTLKVAVGCGKCMECMKQKARAWSVRLQEEVRHDKTGEFVTLTFSNKEIAKLATEIKGIEGYERDNVIAKLGTRRFLERWRKENKKSVKHWLITELGHEGTENIHLHGIIFGNKEQIKKHWKYGFVYIGDFVNETTANYCVKYASKVDAKHPNYQPKILTSAGIGKGYIERWDAKRNKYNRAGTEETYVARTGARMNLPIYYRNNIYTEEEREYLWIEKLNKQERWVNGVRIDVSTEKGIKNYFELLKQEQKKNKRLGYGDNEKNWEKIRYENEARNLNFKKRIAKIEHGKNNKKDGKPSRRGKPDSKKSE